MMSRIAITEHQLENMLMKHKKPSPTDPARSLALLWGSQTAAGRSGLTLKAIVTAATDLADINGVDALSTRNAADRLGVRTKSLCTHVPVKSTPTRLTTVPSD